MEKKYADISITWHGDTTSISGSAQHARLLLEPLILGGANVKIEPIKTTLPLCDDQHWIRLFSSCINNPPGLIKINHCQPPQGTPNPNGGKNIIYTFWETTKPPVNWIQAINSYSELWTTNGAALASTILTVPSKVLECPIDIDKLLKLSSSLDIVGLEPDTVVIGSTGYWNNRRNMSDLIIAYCTAFSITDRICLVLKVNTGNPNNPNEKARVLDLIRQIKANINKPNMPNITVVQDILSGEAMDSLISRFNIYASTSRGDSKNITMMKCMALGKPCVFIPNLANKSLLDCTTLSGNRLLYTTDFVYEPVIQMPGLTPDDSWTRADTYMFAEQLKKAYIDLVTKDLSRDRKKVLDGLKTTYDTKIIENKFVKLIREAMPFKVQVV